MRNKACSLAFATVLGLSLVGCGNDAGKANSDEALLPTSSSSANTSATNNNESTVVPVEMPLGFVVPFPAEVLRDQIVDTVSGKQRRIQVNAAGITPAAAEEELAAAFKSAGFKGGKMIERGGLHSINYRKDGKVVVIVSVDQTAVEGGTRIRFGWVD